MDWLSPNCAHRPLSSWSKDIVVGGLYIADHVILSSTMKWRYCFTLLIPFLFMLSSTSRPGEVTAYFEKLSLGIVQQMELSRVEGGATNQNYFLVTKKQKFFLRRGSDPQQLEREVAATLAVSKIGLAPEVIAYDLDHDIFITKQIESKRAVSLQTDQEIDDIAALLRRLHDSSIAFEEKATPVELVLLELEKTERSGGSLPHEFVSTLYRLMETYEAPELVPCHLDLHFGNMIHDGERLWFIDWECARNSDPLFDIAVFVSTEGLSDGTAALLIESYDPAHKVLDRSQFELLRALAEARWAIWCLRNHEVSSIDCPYLDWANRFFKAFEARSKRLLATPAI